MTKYLLGFLIAFNWLSTWAAEEPKPNDFEAELQLVEKMSAQTNGERENDLILDSVSSKNSAVSKIPDETIIPNSQKLIPNSQESNTNKKIRRIPSR